MASWCIPTAHDAAVVWHRADVRDVSTRPSDPRRPLRCLDEPSRHRRGAVTPALPVAPGHPARPDEAYGRGGVVTRFLVTAPLRGWRPVTVSDHRTRRDVAAVIRDLVAVPYRDAARRVLVRDKRNSHRAAARAAAFPPAEAKRLADKRAVHHTPNHGAWLTVAAIKRRARSRQCLDRRLADQPTREREVAAWQRQRNAATTTVDWRFTTADARMKRKHLSPSLQP